MSLAQDGNEPVKDFVVISRMERQARKLMQREKLLLVGLRASMAELEREKLVLGYASLAKALLDVADVPDVCLQCGTDVYTDDPIKEERRCPGCGKEWKV